MSDTSKREELIEEAAKAIYDLHPEPRAWKGNAPFEYDHPQAQWRTERARDQARAALAVFEQAHTPTDDEREALDEPTDRTSNHGWAIWHLTQAKQATSVAEAQMHAACANARAQLQISCEMGAQRGVDPNGPTLWTEEWS